MRQNSSFVLKYINMPTILLVILVILANALANVFLKIGADSLRTQVHVSAMDGLVNLASNPWVLLGSFLLITNFPLYNILLQRVKLSIAFPLVTTAAFALAIIISAVFLKERLVLGQYIGLAMLPIAITLIVSTK